MRNRLSICREDLGLLQEDMAKALGVTKYAVSGWENDTSNIPLKRLVQFGDIYGLSIDYLLFLNKENIKYKKLGNIDRKVLGSNLRNLREKENLEQEQMADKCGVHPVTLCNYESGKYNITSYNLYIICKTFNVSMDEILGKEKVNTSKVN